MVKTCAIEISIPATGCLMVIIFEIAGCPEREIG
jgi:hypothetical protein